MTLAHTRRSGGRGFTLVELLIVIAIIALLVSLLSAAVWKAVTAANRTRNRSEIGQLGVALDTFKSRYGFYPPSRLMLAERLAFYPPNPQPGSLAYDSVQILLKMFPKAGDQWSRSPTDPRPSGIDWNGNGVIDNGITILEGDQCLVFFLGGIPDNFSGAPNCTGFSTNGLDPAFHIRGSGDIKPPFFEFDSSRLVRADGLPPAQGQPPRDKRFYSYLDNYRLRPFAYFSAGNSSNDYNRYYRELKNSDCRSLIANPSNPSDTRTVWPYAEAAATFASPIPTKPRYIKPDSYQIISAGADGLFGTGTVINGVIGQQQVWIGGPTFPAGSGYSTGEPGYDDQSNFRETTLSSGN